MGPPPRECRHEFVHDYLISTHDLKKLSRPPVEELPPRFGPDGLVIREPSNLLNAGQFLGFTISFLRVQETAHIDWDLTETLTRINERGRALGRPAVRRTRLRRIVGFDDREIGFRISGRPALYRLELELRDGSSGRLLGSYGEYVRVLRRTSDPRLLLAPASVRAGATASIGVAEFGTGFLVFKPGYSVEAFDGGNWVATAIHASTPEPLFGQIAGPGEVALCSKLPIPPATPPGLYRFNEPVEHMWGAPRPERYHPVLTTEFTILP